MADFTPIGVEAVVKGLEKFGGDLSKMGSGMDKLGDKAGAIGKTFLGVGAQVLKFGAIAAGAAVAGAAALAGGLVTMALKTAASADELVELSDKTGLSVERLQELTYIGEQTGTSMETVTGAMARLVRSMDAATKAGSPAADAFKELGVSVKNADGSLRDTEDVFADAIDALGKIDNEAERDAISMALFGKSAQELNPLIKAGSAELADMADEAHRLGAVMSEESARSAAEFNDKLAGLKMGLAGIGMQIGGALIPIMSKFLDNVIAPLIPKIQLFGKAFANFITSLSNGDTLERSISSIAGFFETILPGSGAVIKEVAGFIDTIVLKLQEFGTMVAPIVNQVLAFMAEHWEAIKGALIAVGAALAATGIVTAIVGIVAAINPVSIAIAAIVAAVALLGAAWSENWFGIRDTIIGIYNDILKPMFDEWIAYLQVAIPIAIGILTDFWNNSLLPAFQTLAAAWVENIQPLLESLYAWLAENLPLAISTLAGFWLDTLWPAISDVFEWISENVVPILTEIAVWLMENIPVAIQNASDYWTGTLQPALNDVWTFISENVIPIISEVVAWLQENIPLAIQAAADYWNETLLPALTTAWEYFNDHILPIIQDVIDIVVELGEIALLALAKFWNETLLPALEDVWNYFNDNILPILEDVYDYIAEEIGPKLQWFKEEIIDPLAKAIGEGLSKAIDWVHQQLENLLELLETAKERLKGNPFMGESPSPLEISMLGIARATQTAADAVDILGDAIEKAKNKGGGGKGLDWVGEMLGIAGSFGSLGNAASSRYEKKTLTPLQNQLKAVNDEIAKQQELLTGAGGNWQAQLEIVSELRRLDAERAALAEQVAAAEERVLKLKEQQEDIAFLRSQMDFLKLIKDEQLDIGAILGGLELGLNADLPALIEAMTRAMQELVAKAEAELEIGSPSRVFEMIGERIMAGLGQGILSGVGAPLSAMQGSLTALASAPARMASQGVQKTTNIYMGGQSMYGYADERTLTALVSSIAGSI